MAIEQFELERLHLEQKIKEVPKDVRLYRSLGMVYAGLNNKLKAIKYGRKAIEIHSMKNDAISTESEIVYVKILLMVDEFEEALNKLEFLLDYTSAISIEYLKIDPFWKHFHDKGIFQDFGNLIRGLCQDHSLRHPLCQMFGGITGIGKKILRFHPDPFPGDQPGKIFCQALHSNPPFRGLKRSGNQSINLFLSEYRAISTNTIVDAKR